ncbi:hypothetical protein Ppa06_58250 [Planomonospora parontospora subsp. parontospora]|uniref:Tail terminator n=2 Tax=Planomonospora parontospora TaxID=58119 RepID=A0AA37F7J0_9ACTN|nr:minor capsid protein [Planomonospora parontospora]GGK90221.1 hypothetical protein GCM10010126_57060 [Planomonospora parontospora]GII12027.1 hypothetical protein Ppa06_58250 [Planomonospora parontospora subsp. parontospora]
MSWTRDLLTGLAELLAARGVGDWNPSGIYTDAQTAITISGLPSKPDLAISLTYYGLGNDGEDVTQADASAQVQVRIRGKADPRLVDDLADEVFEVLHGLSSTELPGGVWVLLCQRTIVAPPDRDQNGRRVRADSYDLLCHRPSLHRAE